MLITASPLFKRRAEEIGKFLAGHYTHVGHRLFPFLHHHYARDVAHGEGACQIGIIVHIHRYKQSLTRHLLGYLLEYRRKCAARAAPCGVEVYYKCLILFGRWECLPVVQVYHTRSGCICLNQARQYRCKEHDEKGTFHISESVDGGLKCFGPTGLFSGKDFKEFHIEYESGTGFNLAAGPMISVAY